ncbi:pimeloyl-ACP methyl ester carboxylesterase [Lipingzhangella halophila]|uniref:Pimeloyl-ACP methyl ester carboxylesterase n=1 Tax=Lipingzhangella halophila TaxID=1783352 RepID=A0A7W7W3W5_9ACTN|nr:alpha/beta hydrolase [Lipingzhangella halophila]MBB4933492.1 pimeloyl-ACP methyl ester carboxylesterase [Lipingzhangella halophila]
MMHHETNGLLAAPGAEAPLGHHYEVDGRRLLLHQSGTGGPSVVILPGAGFTGLDYLNLHERVSAFTSCVLYDRAGTGWSDRVALPRTAAEVVTELRGLLRAAGVPAPYVLVGHSLGGAYIHRFAQMFPEDVAGLLWLEGFHAAWNDHMPEELHLEAQSDLPELDEDMLAGMRDWVEGMYARWPDGIRELLIEERLRPDWVRVGARERSSMIELATELRTHAHAGLPDVPLIACSGTGLDPGQDVFLSEELIGRLNGGKQAMDRALADSVPRGEYRVLDGASHSTVHIDRTDDVVRAIHDLVERADR